MHNNRCVCVPCYTLPVALYRDKLLSYTLNTTSGNHLTAKRQRTEQKTNIERNYNHNNENAFSVTGEMGISLFAHIFFSFCFARIEFHGAVETWFMQQMTSVSPLRCSFCI